MKQARRRKVECIDVNDIEVEAGGASWSVQFTRQFEGQYREAQELDQVRIEVGLEDGRFVPIEALDAILAAGIRQGITDWCLTHPPEPPEVDEDYERAAERARGNDFERTGGKDWT